MAPVNQDTPLLIALCAIAGTLILNVLVSTHAPFFAQNSANDLLAQYTFWLFLATAALAAASCLQLWFLIRTDKTARISADAARQSAVAAQESVRLASETAQMELRAYVYIDALEIRNFGTEKPLEAWLMLKNSGNTPAFDFQRMGHIAVYHFPMGRFPTVIWGNVKGFLAPKGEVYFGPLPTQKALTSEEYAAVVAGTSAIYVWGNLRYTDAFKQERYVQFRSYYRGDGIPVVGTVHTQQDIEGNGSI